MSTEARDTPKDALADALSDYFDVDIDEACEGLTDWLTDPSNRDVVLAAMGGVRSEVVVSEIPLKVWTFPEGREAARIINERHTPAGTRVAKRDDPDNTTTFIGPVPSHPTRPIK